MDRLHSESVVSGALGKVLRISQVFGIASLEFENVRNGWRIRVSRAASVYGKLLILLLCGLAASSLIWDFTLDAEISTHSSTASRTMLSAATVCLTSIVLLAEVYNGLERMQNLTNALAIIQKVNLELNTYMPYNNSDWKESLIMTLPLLAGSLVVIEDYCLLFYEITINHGNYLKDGLYVAYYLETFILKVLTIQLVMIVRYALSSFNHLNECLRDLLKQIQFMGAINDFPKPAPMKVRRLGFLHCCLTDVVRSLNDHNGVVLVLLMLSFLLHLIMTPYTFITKMFGNTVDFYKSMSQVLWAIYYVIDLVMIVEPCHQTHKQMERSKGMLSRLMHRTQAGNYDLIAELDVFYTHLIYNDAAYAPLKVFTINRALITTMLGTIITYLVVIIDH